MEYRIIQATTGFRCRVCGRYTPPGSNCISQYGIMTCLCILPVRRLKFLRRHEVTQKKLFSNDTIGSN